MGKTKKKKASKKAKATKKAKKDRVLTLEFPESALERLMELEGTVGGLNARIEEEDNTYRALMGECSRRRVDLGHVRDVRLLARERGHHQGYADGVRDAHDLVLLAAAAFYSE